MRKNRVCGLLAAIGLMAAASDAYAVTVDCSTPTALLTAFASGGTENTTYGIINGPCTGGIAITQDNISIAQMGNQTITGGTRSGVAIQGAHNILLQNLTIQNAPGFGVEATGGASVSVLFSPVSGNAAGGVHARENSTLTYGNATITSASGENVGPAVAAVLSSSVVLKSVTTVHGPDAAPTILADQSSAIVIDGGGSSITTSTAMGAAPGPAVVALHSSSVTLFTGLAPMSPNVTGPSNNHTIVALQGSSVSLRNMNVTGSSATESTIEAGANSSVVLAGGSTIDNTGGGLALQIDHSSSLFENDGTQFGFTGAADSITGDGLVQVQSSMQLGTGGATPSTWTGNIRVQQNSSFAMVGGMTVTGFVRLGQQSNGFLNTSNGGTNTVSGTVFCPFSPGNPSAHVSNPTAVTPMVNVAATFATAVSPQCLQF